MSETLAPPPPGANDDPRHGRAALLAFASDGASELALREALTAELGDAVEVVRGTLADAARTLQRRRSPQVLIVDLGDSAQPLPELADLSQVVEPDTRVLAIGPSADLGLYRTLTHGLGVLDYLFKPVTREMVTQFFIPHIARQSVSAGLLRGGRVIAVTGVRGGVGSSTVAANLAWFLAARARRHTLLLDGDLQSAAAAMLLSVKATPGLRAALEKPDRVDDLFIDRTAQAVGERLHVLASDGKPGEAPSFAPGALTRLLELLRRRFKFLVCDAPVSSSRFGRELFDVAHQRVLVSDPSVAGARDLLRHLGLTSTAGGDAALVVLNHAGIKGGLDAAQFERACGRAPDILIPHRRGTLRAAADIGEPAAATDARLRAAIGRIAARAGSVRDVAPAPRGWLRRAGDGG